MRVLIFISWPVKAWCIDDAHVATLRERFPDVDFVYAATAQDARRHVEDVDVAFTPFMTPEMVAAAPRLRWVHSSAAAVEGLLPLADLAARRIVVTNSRGVQAIPMAEHVIGGLLVLSRRFDRILDAQRDRRWIQNELSDDWPWMLYGQKMTIVGLGTIGVEVAKRAQAFGMRIWGVTRSGKGDTTYAERIQPASELQQALPHADYIVIAAPDTPETKHLIGAEQIARMKRGARLINIGRGSLLDEAALISALESGQLGGAALDVTTPEPLPSDSALWKAPNLFITPHTSGVSDRLWERETELLLRLLDEWFAGQELSNRVDLSRGY